MTQIGIGIDFGMTYSGAAISLDNLTRPILVDGLERIQTYVFVPEEVGKKILVGSDASFANQSGQAGVLHTLFKRNLADNLPMPTGASVHNGMITPQQLTAEVLRYIKIFIDAYLTKERLVDSPHYVLSYPVSWSEVTAGRLLKAAREAGFTNPTLLPEPIASAIIGRDQKSDGAALLKKRILVCDFGGGTVDFGVVEPQDTQKIKVAVPSKGKDDIGMSNLDKVIALLLLDKKGMADELSRDVLYGSQYPIVFGEQLEKAWREQRLPGKTQRDKQKWRHLLRQIANDLKIWICNRWKEDFDKWSTNMPDGTQVVVTRHEMKRIFEAMRQAVLVVAGAYREEYKLYRAKNPSYLLLAGGGRHLPNLEDDLLSLFNGAKPLDVANAASDTLVQMGSAVYARSTKMLLEPPSNATYGIVRFGPNRPTDYQIPDENNKKYVTENEEGQRLFANYEVFIAKGKVLRTPKEISYRPLNTTDPSTTFYILRGEEPDPWKNEEVDTIIFPLPPARHRDHKVVCHFSIGNDGLLHIAVRDENGTFIERAFYDKDSEHRAPAQD